MYLQDICAFWKRELQAKQSPFFKIARNPKDYTQSNTKIFEFSVFKISNKKFWPRFCLLFIE